PLAEVRSTTVPACVGLPPATPGVCLDAGHARRAYGRCAMTVPVRAAHHIACAAAYAAFAIALIALPAIAKSEPECRFVGGDQGYTGAITEPGYTAGILSVTVAPLLAIGSLVVLALVRRAGQRVSRLALAAAVLVFPLVL